ncbi:hypothetical protein KUCAC02_011968 [Chaenocephalus aceratus]|uniref:Uncharacterized protein n=1 Tax=Chaenocephalus aceratus TaxID=36190 RepID=A0ACB9X9B1_CHAAC|nr:hypothetical protein KUCAC02_011968 [Chaenocephalus aceratus]
MGCLGNSKTEDQRERREAQREANKKIEKQLQKDKQIYRATHRLLLLALLPPCITFWDVVLGNIVNSVTLPLHKAKNAALCWVFSMLLSK